MNKKGSKKTKVAINDLKAKKAVKGGNLAPVALRWGEKKG